jgi:putative FmdB family regulatory protein
MPIYEYRRPDGTTFELQQSFSDDALTVDPDTGVPVQRVLHAPALHFKGNGFYNTDYGTRNRERETAANKSSSAKDSSKDSSSGGASSGNGSPAAASESSSSEGKAKGEKGSKDSAKSKDAKPVAAKS